MSHAPGDMRKVVFVACQELLDVLESNSWQASNNALPGILSS
jgi:hypothetical protein